MYVLLVIQLSTGEEGWDPFNLFNLIIFCTYHKPVSGFSMLYVVVPLFVLFEFMLEVIVRFVGAIVDLFKL